MRISDWSSDVCSSDLIGLGEDLVQCVAKVFYAHGRRAAVHGMPGSVQADELRVLGQALGKGDDLLSDLVLEADPCCLFPQIGRATCRERVCPYVWILVVAVYLKKKN